MAFQNMTLDELDEKMMEGFRHVQTVLSAMVKYNESLEERIKKLEKEAKEVETTPQDRD